jgi:hypothetical protein
MAKNEKLICLMYSNQPVKFAPTQSFFFPHNLTKNTVLHDLEKSLHMTIKKKKM